MEIQPISFPNSMNPNFFPKPFVSVVQQLGRTEFANNVKRIILPPGSDINDLLILGEFGELSQKTSGTLIHELLHAQQSRKRVCMCNVPTSGPMFLLILLGKEI